MKRYARCAVVALLSGLLTVAGLAQEEGGGHERGFRSSRGLPERLRDGSEGEHPEELLARFLLNPHAAERLGLSADQVRKVQAALFEVREQQIELKARMDKAALQQAKLLTEDLLNEAALMTAIEEAGTLRTEMAKLRIRPLIVVKKTLTPEQFRLAREILHTRLQEAREKWRKDRDDGSRAGSDRLRRDRRPPAPPGELAPPAVP